MEEFEFEFDEDKMMEDSYQILTGRKTQEQILSDDQRDLVLSTEEYEKCEELLYLKNEIV